MQQQFKRQLQSQHTKRRSRKTGGWYCMTIQFILSNKFAILLARYVHLLVVYMLSETDTCII